MVKSAKEQVGEDVFDIDKSIEFGYVYVVDYVINGNIAGVSSFRLDHKDNFKSIMTRRYFKSSVKKKANPIKSIVISNPRFKQKHY